MSTYDYIVKKFNINVGKQYFVDVPEIVGGEGLAKLFGELKLKTGVEIGTDQGEFAEVLCKRNFYLDRLFCIDPWKAKAYEPGQQPESYEDQSFFDKRYEETVERLKDFPEVSIMQKTSMEAIESFDDNSLDFVYIDGNHDFLNVTQDIHFWLKKVKPGGILSGHDYVRYPSHKHNHVQKVVQAYSTSYHLLPVFITNATNKGLKRDRFRSWFLIKS